MELPREILSLILFEKLNRVFYAQAFEFVSAEAADLGRETKSTMLHYLELSPPAEYN